MKQTITSEGTTLHLKETVDGVKIKYGQGYCVAGTALKLTDTGNGYIAKFPSHRSVEQDHYICMDYSQAHLLLLALQTQKGLADDTK